MLTHPFDQSVQQIDEYSYFNLRHIAKDKLVDWLDVHSFVHSYKFFFEDELPFCIRVLLENVVRNCDNFKVTTEDVNRILKWTDGVREEIPFKPARVLLQDFTGVPSGVDLAAMRSAVVKLGGSSDKVNPLVPVDLVIDHSVAVDDHGSEASYRKNEELEFIRNEERFAFLKWAQSAFNNLRVVPPGSGICHQVNLEYLGRVAFIDNGDEPAANTDGAKTDGGKTDGAKTDGGKTDGGKTTDTSRTRPKMIYPDTVVGTDSHTTMISGLGILGWGVGGIEAEAVMLGQPICMLLPDVIGVKVSGTLPVGVTATDLVLKVAQILRQEKVVGKLVEFFGPGLSNLSIADRATISNMSPEFGCTTTYFPCDEQTCEYIRATGRNAEIVEKYFRANSLFRTQDAPVPKYTKVLEIDLAAQQPAIAGPKRPHDYNLVKTLFAEFPKQLIAPTGFRGFGLSEEAAEHSCDITLGDETFTIRHGQVVLAAITSCTNTSNPSVMIAAGLLCQKASRLGLKAKPFVKCSLSPGSHVVQAYLEQGGLYEDMKKVGFFLTGFGCQSCIGNSGDLLPEVITAITEKDLVAAAVLSGNRNFEGRVNPHTRANYLASPPLVVAYALAGRIDFDFEKEPLGKSEEQDIFLKDLWPSNSEIKVYMQQQLTPDLFEKAYSTIMKGSMNWQQMAVSQGDLYEWNPASTYVHEPPFFDDLTPEPKPLKAITDAYCLLSLGDSITTDHISPAGKIALNSPAAQYLISKGVEPKMFNSYGSRRGHDEVMVRGTLANIRLINKMASKVGPIARHVPSGEELSVFDVAMRYKQSSKQCIILAGSEYGSGSSRDWAAKGVKLLGVVAVIAKSFERIHRSNLVGMGVLPLQFLEDQDANTLQLTGDELYSIDVPKVGVRSNVLVLLSDGRSFETVCRIDTPVELDYYTHGGILNYVLREMAASAKKKA
ncbi:aconitase [Gregarina niphandrodes]|uniref:Aconitate hydratase n=1 Tax=Gregarina niphandrodes TaxID=110365 RepID=A0A023B5X3_GRENI|nr:aconitase [Gregarina niphandrodes]EZG63179.1 aconitase [Gregarina niphandrodes]|eukprot:XP_011130695.1 aconitase [Gregarina niphandrodes]